MSSSTPDTIERHHGLYQAAQVLLAAAIIAGALLTFAQSSGPDWPAALLAALALISLILLRYRAPTRARAIIAITYATLILGTFLAGILIGR